MVKDIFFHDYKGKKKFLELIYGEKKNFQNFWMIFEFYKKPSWFFTREVSTLQKNFIEQEVLRIDQRKRVNFFRIFGWFLNLSKNSQIQISKNGPKHSEKIHTRSLANSNHFLLYKIFL